MKLEIGEDRVGTVLLEGALTIQRAAEFRGVLAEALQLVDKLRLDLEQVTEFDLSCMQILCSAHRTYMGSRKCLVMVAKNTSRFEEMMKRLGYGRNVCGADGTSGCLWHGGPC